MKIRKVILMYFLSFLISDSKAQLSVDSVVMQYLKTVKDIPSPTIKIVKKNKSTVRSANFFIEDMDSVHHENLNLKAFLFGSSASHTRKYFLLHVISKESVYNKIIDTPTLEEALKTLFAYIKEWDLSDAEKSVFVRVLTYAYN